MRLSTLSVPLALLILAGCQAPSPAVDVEAERAALLEADRAWYESYSTSDDPAGVFVGQMLDEAVLLPPGAPIARGTAAVRATIDALESMPGFEVTWSPTEADVGSGGDLGYTLGTYRMTMEGPEGPNTTEGKYLTIWKKRADGTWAVSADMFNADSPPPGM